MRRARVQQCGRAVACQGGQVSLSPEAQTTLPAGGIYPVQGQQPEGMPHLLLRAVAWGAQKCAQSGAQPVLAYGGLKACEWC